MILKKVAITTVLPWMLCAQAASAAPPSPPDSELVTGGFYPKDAHYFFAGGNTAMPPTKYKGAASQSFGTLPAHIKRKLVKNNTYLYLWDNIREAEKYLGTSIDHFAGGWSEVHTFPGDDKRYFLVNLFELVKPPFSKKEINPDPADFAEITIHEQGHAIDNAFGFFNSISWVPLSLKPISTFRTNLEHDWAVINKLPEKHLFLRGIPKKRAVKNKEGNWTWASYTPPPIGTPKRNQRIIQDLFPAFTEPSEMFAMLWQQNRFAISDFANPYTDRVALNGRTIKMGDILGKFPMAKNGQRPKQYFQKLWQNDPTFSP